MSLLEMGPSTTAGISALLMTGWPRSPTAAGAGDDGHLINQMLKCPGQESPPSALARSFLSGCKPDHSSWIHFNDFLALNRRAEALAPVFVSYALTGYCQPAAPERHDGNEQAGRQEKSKGRGNKKSISGGKIPIGI